jgi:hypothetical protein
MALDFDNSIYGLTAEKMIHCKLAQFREPSIRSAIRFASQDSTQIKK